MSRIGFFICIISCQIDDCFRVYLAYDTHYRYRRKISMPYDRIGKDYSKFSMQDGLRSSFTTMRARFELIMELRQLEYFIAIVETGSFSLAAERCNITQPSLSQQIIKLENEIGQQLFDRLGRSILLTEVGKVLYPYAQGILSEVRQAQFAVTQGYSPTVGSIAIGIIPTLGSYVLRDTIGHFKEAYPDANLVIHEDTTDALLEKLMNAKLDVCYVSLPIDRPQITTEKLFVEPLYIAIHHQDDLAAMPVISADMLKTTSFIQLTDKNCLSNQLDAFCYVQKIDPPIVYQTTQLATALEFVHLKMGISLVPACAAAAYPHDDIKFLDISENPPSRVIVAARHRARSRSVLDSGFTESLITTWNLLVADMLA